ncbi:MAG TPA: hypothetical protein VHS05_14790 [Pyrinomonadaceae bacterium]|jgi:hypothetical protein|nr:hypothetical protein [Pyrinomonadaceae bacterium]
MSRLTAIALVFICVAFVVFGRTAHRPRGEYGLADDLPRGAFVYAQFSNLPALLEQWQHSKLKDQYLNSTNYRQLQHRHLMLKLISRWEEFNNALGFQLDTATITGATETTAAVAVYDIGELNLVFIAPLSEEKIALTQFVANKNQFEETKTPDGAVYYKQALEADHGRQKQVLAFATLNGRFILASDENLLLRTISNISRPKSKDSLADDPAFTTLSQKVKPHFVTVWVDQTKLNNDYYFKHYWLPQNMDQLKGIRAGMFDLEQQKGGWIERREFLTTAKEYATTTPIPDVELKRLYSMAPEDAPFVRLRKVTSDPALPATIVRDTLFETSPGETEQAGESWSWKSYDGEDFYPDNSNDDWRYSYLDYSYDSLINDPYDARVSEHEEPGGNPLATEVEHQFFTNVQTALAAARPSTMVLATRPHTTDGPLFVEFQRAAIIHLQSAGTLKRDLLEKGIALAAQGRLTVAGRASEPVWEDRVEGSNHWRQLHLPLLGWEICYALNGGELIVTNSAELLKNVLDSPAPKGALEISADATNDLTIVRFDQRKSAFDDIMNTLDKDGLKAPADSISNTFFSGEIGSLLDVTSELNRIEITRRPSSGGLHEEIHFVLKS